MFYPVADDKMVLSTGDILAARCTMDNPNDHAVEMGYACQRRNDVMQTSKRNWWLILFFLQFNNDGRNVQFLPDVLDRKAFRTHRTG